MIQEMRNGGTIEVERPLKERESHLNSVYGLHGNGSSRAFVCSNVCAMHLAEPQSEESREKAPSHRPVSVITGLR